MTVTFQETFHESLHLNNQSDLELVFEPFSKGDLTITLDEDFEKASISAQVKEASHIKVIIHNRSLKDPVLNTDIHVMQDAQMQMGFLDLENNSFTWDHLTTLDEPGADFEILTGQLCLSDNKKINNTEVRHCAHDTIGNIRNFAVLFDKSYYEMVANGNILKGCHQAQSHQATRILTLGKGHTAKAIPLLLIDENDVKASHALTVGQPDEDQLYYLQSRGLTMKQAMGLLSVGYFLPVIDMIEDENLHESLREEMENKVGLYGSIANSK